MAWAHRWVSSDRVAAMLLTARSPRYVSPVVVVSPAPLPACFRSRWWAYWSQEARTASYSSSGVHVSWNDRLLPGVGGASLFPPVWPAGVVLVSPWRAMVSRVARAPGLFMSGLSVVRAWVSLWAWRAVSSSVST